tara:strand:+ start:555 stop:2642 length:2088 start_codon:yes stop_codon:yes gene_type:complete
LGFTNNLSGSLQGFRKLILGISVASVIFVACLPSAHAEEDSYYMGLGDLPGGVFHSDTSYISGDGKVIAGKAKSASSGPNYEAFRWTSETGIVGLGDLSGALFHSFASRTNYDGSVIVGASTSSNSGNSRLEAFRWTSEDGMIAMGDLAGGAFNSRAGGINGDGSVIVGFGTSSSGQEAFRWTQETGMVGLGDLAGGSFGSSANSVSKDGKVIVGWGTGSSGYEAFRWTQETGMVGLGDLTGGSYESVAYTISANGKVIVGHSVSSNGQEGYRWTSEDGMIAMGDLEGGTFESMSYAVNGDGSVIVGYGTTINGHEATRWTAETGLVRLEDWLANAGVTISGYSRLEGAYGISEDGTIITGDAIRDDGHTEGFIARVGPIGSGILDPVTTAVSVKETGDTIQNLTASGLTLPLFGAHHHPLMMMYKPDRCAWASVDAAKFKLGEDGHLLNQEVGACHAFFDRKLYIGAGVGLNQSRREGYLDGEQELDGQYGLIEINYRPTPDAPIFGLIGMYGHWNADIERAYLNAGTRDISKAETDIQAAALKVSFNWPEAATIGDVAFSPKASYTISRTEIDGYTETGGGFPARFDDRDANAQQIRIGVDIDKSFNEGQTTFRTILEGVHQFNRNGGSVSGELIGLYDFDNTNDLSDRTWGRVGFEVDHNFGRDKRLMATAFGATNGGDPEFTAAINFSFPF